MWFVARNAFAASAIVRNAPTGPFLVVNMVFGAIGAKFAHYFGGMALGVIPKIALVAFGLQAIQSALEGNLWAALAAAMAALAVFLGGFFIHRFNFRSWLAFSHWLFRWLKHYRHFRRFQLIFRFLRCFGLLVFAIGSQANRLFFSAFRLWFGFVLLLVL